MSKGISLLICLFLPIAFADAAELYQSNELGMEIAPIGESQRPDHQWVLEVSRSGQKEVKTLTDHGKPFSRWELTYRGGRVSSESVYHDGVLASVTEYRGGHPVRQTEYTDGKPSIVRKYSYTGNMLESITVSDGEGKLLYRDLYSEGADGRMRRAVREAPDGRKSIVSLTFSGDSLVSQWLGSGGDGELLHYSNGSVVSTEKWKGTELQSEESVSPVTGGSVKVSRDFKSGRVTRRTYNSGGKIVSEVVEKDGNILQSVDYRYSNGRLSSKLIKTPGRREEVRYGYDNAGELMLSKTTVNRRLEKVTHYTAKNSYVEDLYLNGELVLHAFYEKGKLVREVPASGAPAGVGQGTGG